MNIRWLHPGTGAFIPGLIHAQGGREGSRERMENCPVMGVT